MKIKVKVNPDGRIELITQDGNFDAGKDALEKLTEILRASDIKVTGAKPIETHRHDLIREGNRITVHSHVGEGGSPHTH